VEYVTTILDQLTGAVEQSRLRSEAFQRAGGIPGLVDLLRSVDRLPDIQDRIRQARAGGQWVGAIPTHEPVATTIPAPHPNGTNPIGIDGSQIYPSLDDPVAWAYVHAASWGGGPALWVTEFYGEDAVLEESGYPVPSHVIDAWRALSEARVLQQIVHQPNIGNQVVLVDGSLLPWVRNGRQVLKASEEYRRCILDCRGHLIAAVTSSPASRHLVHLLRLAAGEAGQSPAFVKHISDAHIARHLLPIAHRSALFQLGLPQNERFERAGAAVCSFYLRTSAEEILRVEMPSWVAQDNASVAVLHATILADSGSLAYPTCLTCAHHAVAIGQGLAEELHQKALAMYVRQGGSINPASAKNRGKGHP